MVTLRLRSIPRGHLRAARGRAGERGAAVFVVVLVITMLTTIGLFAARSASLSTAASGHSRQMTQTNYMTEYAMLSALSELSTERREGYIKLMTRSDFRDDCATLVSENVSNRTCYTFSYGAIEGLLGMPIVNPRTALAHGSLGPGDVEADFVIEMTDLGPSLRPIPGMDLTSAGAAKLSYMEVTLTAIGQVRPIPINGDPATVDLASAISAGIEVSRAHLIVGPLPSL